MKNSLKSLKLGQNKKVYHLLHQESSDSDILGKLLVTLSITAPSAKSARNIGESIFDTIREMYFANPTRDPYEALEVALKEANELIASLSKNRKNPLTRRISGIVCIHTPDNTLHLTAAGDGQAYLIRRRSITTITDGLHQPGEDDPFINIASGQLESSDNVVFTTASLTHYISAQGILRTFSNYQSDEATKRLSELIMLDDDETIALNVLHVTPPLSKASRQIEQVAKQVRQFVLTWGNKAIDKAKSTDLKLPKNLQLQDIRQGTEHLFTKAVRVKNNHLQVNLNDQSRSALLAICIVVLVIGAGLMIGQKVNTNREIGISNELVNIRDEIARAERIMIYDKDQAYDLLRSIRSQAEDLLAKRSRLNHNNIIDVLNDVDARLDKSTNTKRILEPELVANLENARRNINAQGMLLLNNQPYAYDSDAVYPVVLDQVNTDRIAEVNDSIVTAAAFNERRSIVFYTANGRMYEYQEGKKIEPRYEDEQFAPTIAFDDYSSYFYALAPTESAIFKYYRATDQYGSSRKYNDDDVDLSNTIDLAIDGDIYALHQDGEITRMRRGGLVDFDTDNIPDPLPSAPTKIFTTGNLGKLYLLDPESSRIITFSKSKQGAYYGQYIINVDEPLRDMAINEDETEGYVMTQDKIYKFDL